MDKIKEYYNCSSLNMIVELTNSCNLRCKYCFENSQTEKRKFSVMSKDTLRKAIDFLLADRINSHLTFFGGEPLLCKDLILFGIQYGNETARKMKKYIAYSVVTNGTEMDESFIQVLNENNVNVIYSFDGNEFSQNRFRPFASGKGSYDIVVSNLKRLLKTRKDERFGHLIVRPTITSETIGLLHDIYKELIGLGCKEISFSLVSAQEDKEYAIKEEDLNSLRDAYGKMIEIYYTELLNGNSYNKFFESILDRIESNSVNREFCDCGKRYVAIDVNGNVYPCEGFIGIKQFRIGNIISGEFEENWITPQNVDENVKCKECWARYLCGGSCYHEAWIRTGCVNGRDKLVCETYRISFEYALKLYARLNEQDISIRNITRENLLPAKTVPITNDAICKSINSNTIYVGDGCNNRLIRFNNTAEMVFRLCDGLHNIYDIYKAIVDEYECDKEVDIYPDISEIINSFLEAGIISLMI